METNRERQVKEQDFEARKQEGEQAETDNAEMKLKRKRHPQRDTQTQPGKKQRNETHTGKHTVREDTQTQRVKRKKEDHTETDEYYEL